MPGDLIHVDLGITYLRLNTDTQQHAYVLRPGEKEAPDYLQAAFEKGNKVQDIFTSKFKKGLTGNEILKTALEQCRAENIEASIYTIPSAITDTLRVPPSGCGISRTEYPDKETIPSTKIQPMPLNLMPVFFSKNGTRRSASCWRKMPYLMGTMCATSMADKQS
jgi:hypothetical protein